MAESVFAMRLVNLRSVTCYTDQDFSRKCSVRNLQYGPKTRLIRGIYCKQPFCPLPGFKVINRTVGLLDYRNLQTDIVAELHATANHSLLTAAFCPLPVTVYWLLTTIIFYYFPVKG